MNAGSDNDRFGLSNPNWVLIAVGILLLAWAVWIAFSSRGESYSSVDTYNIKPDLQRHNSGAGPQEQTHAIQPPSAYVVPSDPIDSSALANQAEVSIKPQHTKSPVKTVAKPHSYKKPMPPLKGMFPMGSVVESQPQPTHPYREIPELSPSFPYGGKLWSPTGWYITYDQADLVPTGFEMGGRRLFALANTGAPDKVLFLQSARDPGKFAIYR